MLDKSVFWGHPIDKGSFAILEIVIWKNCLVWFFTHRVVFEENRTVLVVDVDEARDHDKDEETEDCDDHNLNRGHRTVYICQESEVIGNWQR